MINDRESSWPGAIGVGDEMNTKKRMMNAADHAEAMTMNASFISSSAVKPSIGRKSWKT
jgi:hypothetical protein